MPRSHFRQKRKKAKILVDRHPRQWTIDLTTTILALTNLLIELIKLYN